MLPVEPIGAGYPPLACLLQKVSSLKQKSIVEEIERSAQDIVDTVREPLLILDTSLRVRSANRAFYQTFQVSPEETENRLIYELGNGQWGITDLRTPLQDVGHTSYSLQ